MKKQQAARFDVRPETVTAALVVTPDLAALTTSGTRTFTVNPAEVAVAAFGGIGATTLVAGQSFPSFSVQYKDQFGNLTDNAGVMTVYLETTGGDSAIGTITMNRTGLGTYQSVVYPMTKAGIIKLRPVSATMLTLQNAPVLTVVPAVTARVEFRAVPDTVQAGNNVPEFTVGYRDQYGNVTDNGIKSLLLVNTAKVLNLTITTGATSRISTGLYAISHSGHVLALPTSGTYSVRASGITVGNTSYSPQSSPGTLTQGVYGTMLVRSAPASVAAFSLVDTLLVAGQSQAAFKVTASDAFQNPVDIPIAVLFMGTGSAGSPTENEIVSTGTITMTRTGVGVYTATAKLMTTAGAYSLSVDGVTVTTGTRSYVVQPTIQYYGELGGIPAEKTAGDTLGVFTATYRDRYGNLTDSLHPVYQRTATYARVAVVSTATIQLTRATLGVYQAFGLNGLQISSTGTYNFSLAGIAAGNLTGTKQLVVTHAGISLIAYSGVDTLLSTGGLMPYITIRLRDRWSNGVDIDQNVINGLSFARDVNVQFPAPYFGTIPLTRLSAGVYRADTTRFDSAGVYT